MQALAHLHPVQTDSLVFTTEVPSVPAGPLPAVRRHHARERAESDVTNRVEIPPAPGAVTPSDSDDTWDRTRIRDADCAGRGAVAVRRATRWRGRAAMRRSSAGEPTDLRVRVRDSTGSVATLHPYLGMAAHAVVVATRRIGVHPSASDGHRRRRWRSRCSRCAIAATRRTRAAAHGRRCTPTDMAEMPMSGEIDLSI